MKESGNLVNVGISMTFFDKERENEGGRERHRKVRLKGLSFSIN